MFVVVFLLNSYFTQLWDPSRRYQFSI